MPSRSASAPVHGIAVGKANILGVACLIFWTLMLVVVVKYLTVVMRADNHGEGGIMALLALVSPSGRAAAAGRR